LENAKDDYSYREKQAMKWNNWQKYF